MSFGYVGRILHVDLTASRIWVEEPPDSFYRTYFGGSGMGTYYVLKETSSGVDPLGPGNVLTMFVSPVAGVPISGQSRFTINAKSPLTGAIGDSQAGGFFPAELKFAGFDGIVITGRAVDPVYLYVHDGKAELRPAGHLWGRTTSDVDIAIKTELGDDKVQVAQCGPAGEQLVLLANVINMGNRANGRTGMGAVMGSKNLKAVVARTRGGKVPVAHPDRVRKLSRLGAAELPNHGVSQLLHNHGTAGVVGGQNAGGTFPAYNYNEGQFAGWEGLCGEAMTATILHGNDTCFACGISCKREVEAEWQGHAILPRSGGPEYETIATLGSYCGICDLKAVSYANQLCNEYGLDTIGAGATIAWLMECAANGVVSEAEIGIPLRWGDPEAVVSLIEMIAARRGIGDILAVGSAKAAVRLGKGQQYLITVKGSEAPAHMPQAKRSLALIYAVQPFGADHQSHNHDPSIEHGASALELERAAQLGFDYTLEPRSLESEKIRYAFATQRVYSFDDVAGLCQFVWGSGWHLYGPNDMVEFVQAVTGWDDFTLAELLAIGERRLALMRVFNAREGLTAVDDRLPEKFFAPLTGTGPTAGIALDRLEVQNALSIYYDLAGWDNRTGAPSKERLARLGIDWAADNLPA